MSFQLNDLTEEIFGHLCNVALTKCSDKFEKKRAGCGGTAMRKRVLIKNFVSDLFKMHKKASNEQEMASDEEYDEYEPAQHSYYDEEMEDVRIDDLNNYDQSNQIQHNDCWLSQADVYSNGAETLYYDRPYGYEAEKLQPLSYSAECSNGLRSYSYDIYSVMSEQANEGDMPPASDPLASISSIMQHPVEPSAYNGMFGCDGGDSRFFNNDDYFMTTQTENNYEMERYDDEVVELMDLDVTTGQNKNHRMTEIYLG